MEGILDCATQTISQSANQFVVIHKQDSSIGEFIVMRLIQALTNRAFFNQS